MHRAYLLIILPAVVVGVFYVAAMRYLDAAIQPAPFLGAVGAFVAALLLVRYYQRRKTKRPGG